MARFQTSVVHSLGMMFNFWDLGAVLVWRSTLRTEVPLSEGASITNLSLVYHFAA